MRKDDVTSLVVVRAAVTVLSLKLIVTSMHSVVSPAVRLMMTV